MVYVPTPVLGSKEKDASLRFEPRSGTRTSEVKGIGSFPWWNLRACGSKEKPI